MELDDTLARRDHIDAHIHRELDEPTDEWGVHMESAEAREVKPSKGVESTMGRQTSAERRRRTMALEAQGECRSVVEKTEDGRQSNIIRVQGGKQPQIPEAQGDAILMVLWVHAAESMDEHAIIDKGMETLANIGTPPSMTYVLPQELISLLGRYGKGLSGSDVQQAAGFGSKALDKETHELLDLGDIDEILGESDGVETANISTNAIDIEIEGGGVG